MAVKYLPILENDLSDLNARTGIMEESLLSGLAISQTRTALAHSMSYPITAHLGLPYDLACSCMLAGLLTFNMAKDFGRLNNLIHNLRMKLRRKLQLKITEVLSACDINKWINPYNVRAETVLPLTYEMFTLVRADYNQGLPTIAEIQNLAVGSFVAL